MTDLSAWALVDAFTVEQAACLWCGGNPAKNPRMRTDPERAQIEPYKQMLVAAIQSGELEPDTSANPLHFIGDHSESLISRGALRAYAESKNQRPAFLFDTPLPGNAPPADVPTSEEFDRLARESGATVRGDALATIDPAKAKRRRGRTKGSGEFDDSAALKRMEELIKGGEAKSALQAAGMVADACEGASPDAIVERLRKKYRKDKSHGA